MLVVKKNPINKYPVGIIFISSKTLIDASATLES